MCPCKTNHPTMRLTSSPCTFVETAITNLYISKLQDRVIWKYFPRPSLLLPPSWAGSPELSHNSHPWQLYRAYSRYTPARPAYPGEHTRRRPQIITDIDFHIFTPILIHQSIQNWKPPTPTHTNNEFLDAFCFGNCLSPGIRLISLVGSDPQQIIGTLSLQLALPINLAPNEANYRSEAFMGWRIYVGAGGANSYTIRGRTRMDPLTIRYGSQSSSGRKEEGREGEVFRFHECLESDCQTNAFQQHPLDLCSSPSGRAIYSLFG